MLKEDVAWTARASAARGAVLVLALFMLALFSVIAGLWALRASLQLADANQYALALQLRTAGDTALEHAKAAMSAARQLPKESASAWVVLSSSRTEVTEYRVSLRDTAHMSATALPWSAREARRAAPVVATATSWRWILDPQVASYDQLHDACATALRLCGGDESDAAALAMTLADAYDDNTAVGIAVDGTMGFEGLSLAGVRRGDDRVVPVAWLLRQSAFYDVDYQRDNFAIFGAFTIDAVEPVIASASRTNTRVRLSDRLLDPARQHQWEAFQRLWHRVYAERFIPHAWRGLTALIVTECGGASTVLTILDNDGEWLYFAGYPHAACVRGRFVSIKLGSVRARPGCFTAEARGVHDVWFVTGLSDRIAYRFAWYGEGARVVPHVKLIYGEQVSDTGPELVRAADGVLGFVVTLTPDLPISGLRASQPDVVAWRYTGVHPLQIGGWRWERSMPETLTDALLAWSNAPKVALLAPGNLWYWCNDCAYEAEKNQVTSFVRREESGIPYAVEHVALEPSPLGGWAWRIRTRVQRLHPWIAGEWRGTVCVRAADSNEPNHIAFVVLDNTADTLLVHVGTYTMANALAPRRGSWIRLGGLAESVRRAEQRLITPLGQVAAHEPSAEVPLAISLWVSQIHGQWQLRPPASAPDITPTDAPSSRVAQSPAWHTLLARIQDVNALASVLDSWIQPLGIELPVNAQVAPANWTPTYVMLRRRGRTQWQLPRSYAHWPRDFWRGAEVVFQSAGTRARVMRSCGRTLVLDQDLPVPSRAAATLAPLAGAVFHVTTTEPSEGTWEWRLPPDVCMPSALYVRGFCPPDTNAAARFTIAVWNVRREDFDVLAENARFNQHDVIFAGTLSDDHVMDGQWLRVRIRVTGGAAWIRGGYLVPSAWAGRRHRELGRLVSDAACVSITTRMRRNADILAECHGTALLLRRWCGPQDDLKPIVECTRWRWHEPTKLPAVAKRTQ